MTLTLSSLDAILGAELSALREANLDRQLHPVGRRHGAVVETEHGEAIDFSSNDYLGLASDPRIVAAATEALRDHGVGSTASRLIAGTNPEHVALEAAVAEAFGAERALTFSSGYSANVGIIPALVGRGDVIFADALNHASLIDGCRLSRATVHVYSHGDASALAGLLSEHRASGKRALIVSDGLFSMDGDLVRLRELVELAQRFDAWTYVDDAHAVGVIGDEGRGTASAAGLSGQVEVTLGTFGKAFGAAGAFVYGSETLVEYLLNRARSFVFSTAMLPAQAAAACEALVVARSEPWRRERLAANARLMRRTLSKSGIESLGEGSSPIVPVLIGDEASTVRIASTLAALGFLVGAVRPPTVPRGTSRLRITLSAAHTEDNVRTLAELLADVLSA